MFSLPGGLPKNARRVADAAIAAVMLLFGHYAGFLADVPIGLLLGLVLFTCAASWAAYELLEPSRSPWRLYVTVGVQIAGIASVGYATGWGCVIALGFLYAVAEVIGTVGSRGILPCVFWSIVSTLVGQSAMAAGLAPTLIELPLAHGIAAFALFGLVAGSCMLASAQDRIEQNERRFHALLQNAPDGIIVLDAEGTVTYTSPMAETLLQPTQALAAGRPLVLPESIDPDTLKELYVQVAAVPGATGTAEVAMQERDGQTKWLEVTLTNLLHEPAVQGVVASVRDITAQRLLQDELALRAFYDPLTQLANRAMLEMALERLLAHRRHDGWGVALLLFDLDGFKQVNDRHGHEVGDALLQLIGLRAKACVRQEDMVARLGGDEFAVLLSAVSDPGQAVVVAKRLLAEFQRVFIVEDKHIRVSASIGIAVGVPGKTAPQDLLRAADLAMYKAKSRGRARYELSDSPSLVDEQTRSLRQELEQALEARAFQLVLQPQIDLRNGNLVGLEAALQWKHPQRGRLLLWNFFPSFRRPTSLCRSSGSCSRRHVPRRAIGAHNSTIQRASSSPCASRRGMSWTRDCSTSSARP